MIATRPLIMAKPGATDTPQSAVIEHARKLALAMNADVLLFRSIYKPGYEKDAYELGEGQRKSEALAVTQARSQLDTCAEALRDSGLDVEISVNWKTPDKAAFARIINRVRPEFIVCERSPVSTLDKLERKDPDWQLTQLTDTPILYVDRLPEQEPTGTVWAAVDPMHKHGDHRKLNDLIIEKAMRLARVTGSELHLVHCYSSAKKLAEITLGLASAEHLPAEDIQRDIRDQHHSALATLAKRHGLDSDHVHNLPGIAQVMLPVLAARKQPDFVVAGTTRRGFVAQILLGSTARKLLHRLTGALCIVRLPESTHEDRNATLLPEHAATQTADEH